jgi:hypothetical protein
MHRFAPTVISVQKWKDEELVEQACNEESTEAFMKLITICDEAFMLAVLENYIRPWHAAVVAKCAASTTRLVSALC